MGMDLHLTKKQKDKICAIAILTTLALLMFNGFLAPEHNEYDNYKIYFEAADDVIDIRKVTSLLWVVPAMWSGIYLYWNIFNRYKNAVLLSAYIVITVFFWIFYTIDPDLLASAIIVSIVNILNVLVYCLNDNSLLLLNNTKYSYIDYTYFYASNKEHGKMQIEDDADILKFYVDKLTPTSDDKTFLVNANPIISGLLDKVKNTQYILSQEDYDYIMNKLNRCMNGTTEVLQALEARAIIKYRSIIVDKKKKTLNKK